MSNRNEQAANLIKELMQKKRDSNKYKKYIVLLKKEKKKERSIDKLSLINLTGLEFIVHF